MNKLLICLLIMPLASLATTTEQTNLFCAKHGAIGVNTSSGNWHAITDGQPWGGIFTQGSCIEIDAGRQKSAAVAQWAYNMAGPQSAISAASGSAGVPQKLNFAVQVNVILIQDGMNYKCDNVTMGQGSHGTNNNWWVWAPHKSGIPTLTCTNSNGTTAFFKLEGNSNNSMDFVKYTPESTES